MKPNCIKSAIGGMLLCVYGHPGFSQGFVNLDFESANLSGYPPPNAVPVGDAIPGWTAYIGSTELTTISYDALALDDANVCIVDDNVFRASTIIQGQYSLMLQPGVNPFNGSFQKGKRITFSNWSRAGWH